MSTDETTTLTESTEPDDVLPAPVLDDVLNQVTVNLNELARKTGLLFALEAGQVIVKCLFDDDIESWRSRGTKDTSFRKLAERDGLLVSKTVLHRSVQIYVLHQKLGVPDWGHLGVSHVRAVLGLPLSHQKKLLSNAEKKKWTSTALEKEVEKIKKENKGTSRAGRPPLPTFVKGFDRLKKVVEYVSSEPVPEDVFSTYSPDQAKQLIHDVDLQLAKLNAVRSQVLARIDAHEKENLGMKNEGEK